MNEFLRKMKDGKGSMWLVGLLIGLLLLIISLPTGEGKHAATDIVSEEPKSDSLEENADYEKDLENRLEKVLKQVEGVGDADVMITLKTDEEHIVEKDSSMQKAESEQQKEETTVYTRTEEGAEFPYVKQNRMPEIEGVLVIAQGGGNPVAVQNITEAVLALFPVEAHKIKVMKKV